MEIIHGQHCKSWIKIVTEIDVQVHLTDLDDRSSHNPTNWQYPIINYPVFNANNSTNTSEYFSLSLNTVNRNKGNLRLPEFGQDDILVKPTSINNWILLPSEGCCDFYMRNAQNSIRSFCRHMVCKVRSFLEDSCAILIYFKSVVIFADFVLISAKMTTLLKEMRIAQLSS